MTMNDDQTTIGLQSFMKPMSSAQKKRAALTKCGSCTTSLPQIKVNLLQLFHIVHEDLISFLFEAFPVITNHYFQPKKALVEIQRSSNCDYLREVIHRFGKANVHIHQTEQILLDYSQCTHVHFPGYLPTRFIIKLARLSKSFKLMIESHFYPLRLIDFKKFDDSLQFVRMLNSEPNFDRYLHLSLLQKIFQKDGHVIYKNVDADKNEQINAFKRAHSNLLYGGSVLRPIKVLQN